MITGNREMGRRKRYVNAYVDEYLYQRDAGLSENEALQKAAGYAAFDKEQQQAKRRDKLAQYQRDYRNRRRHIYSDIESREITVSLQVEMLAVLDTEAKGIMAVCPRCTLPMARRMVLVHLLGNLGDTQNHNARAVAQAADSFRLYLDSARAKGESEAVLREHHAETSVMYDGFPSWESFAASDTDNRSDRSA